MATRKCKVTPVLVDGVYILRDEKGGEVVDMEKKRMGGLFLYGLPVKFFTSEDEAITFAFKKGYWV